MLICVFILSSCGSDMDTNAETSIRGYMKKQGVIKDNWEYVMKHYNYKKDGDASVYTSSDLVYKDKKANKYYAIRIFASVDYKDEVYYKVELLNDCVMEQDEDDVKSYASSKTYWFKYELKDCTDTIDSDVILQGAEK